MGTILSTIVDVLSGKKTYAVCAAGLLTAAAIKAGYVVSIQDAMAIVTGLASLYGIFMRIAVDKVHKSVTPQ